MLSNPPHLGRRLRIARQRLGWTQPQTAEHLGASVRSVAGWESETADPLPVFHAKIHALIRLAGGRVAKRATIATHKPGKAVQQ